MVNPAPLAFVVRGALVESVHAGHLAALEPDGAVAFTLGAATDDFYPRSSLKPLQALAMLRTGVELDDRQLALACSSHNGEPMHLEVARTILAGAGLSPDDLQNTPSLPLDADAAAASDGPTALQQNCSGKHAAMLATCVSAGWDTGSYLDPAHPLQRAIAAAVEELTGDAVRYVTIDGCGAPLLSTTPVGLARSFAALATAATGTAEARIAHAMRSHPELVGGTGRDVTAAMTGVPGLIAKDGAEGVYAAALPDGHAVAFKIADGAARPRPVVLGAALQALGAAGEYGFAQVDVLGHGAPVGAVLAAFGPDGEARDPSTMLYPQAG